MGADEGQCPVDTLTIWGFWERGILLQEPDVEILAVVGWRMPSLLQRVLWEGRKKFDRYLVVV